MTTLHAVPPALQERFETVVGSIQKEIHANAVAHGFWPKDVVAHTPVALALICSEIGEAIEADRTAKDNFNEELADIVMRAMDLAEARNIKLGYEIIKKMKHNQTRPYKHGKRY